MKIAILGAPNAGKTTLFNWLTGFGKAGLQARPVNYPGSTVELMTAPLAVPPQQASTARDGGPRPSGLYDHSAQQASASMARGSHPEHLDDHSTQHTPHLVLDTPGLYSVHSSSPEAQATLKALASAQSDICALVVVLDATQLERQLYLLDEVRELQLPCLVALSMHDLLQQQGQSIDTRILQQHYDVPFVLIDGLLGGGVLELLEHIKTIALKPNSKPNLSVESPVTQALSHRRPRGYPAAHNGSGRAHLSRPAMAESLCHGRGQDQEQLNRPDGLLPPPWSTEKQQYIREHNTCIAKACLRANHPHRGTRPLHNLSDTIDSYLLHPYWGLLAFVAVMMSVFVAVFWVAAPFMEGADIIFSWLAGLAFQVLGQGLVASFVSDGVIAGLGAVLVFVPQIFILFFALRLLEASGYLARAALIIDKALTRIGLSGRSFVPLLSGFACAVPAVMAARHITSPREKWLTVFIIPLMSCSARLPVYALLLSFLFAGQSAWKPALALMLIYVCSALIGGLAAYGLNKIIKREPHSFFSLDLPLYRRPKIKEAMQMAWLRVLSYIKKAGPIIFVLSVLIWAFMTYPNYNESDETQRLATSYAGQVGVVMEPVFEPMGLDWRVGVALISAFAAREVFVAVLAVVLGLSSDAQHDTLFAKMKAARTNTGEPLFNWANTLALIVFFMVALQCVSTTGIVAREMASPSMAIVQLVSMNIVAYLLACAIYVGLS